jgi:hypothetical protein
MARLLVEKLETLDAAEEMVTVYVELDNQFPLVVGLLSAIRNALSELPSPFRLADWAFVPHTRSLIELQLRHVELKDLVYDQVSRDIGSA